MTTHPFRDRAAIVGVGTTPYWKNSGVSTLTLALRAIGDALDDAGSAPTDVDGVACHRVGDSVQAAVVAQALGIRDLRFHLDLFGGGSALALGRRARRRWPWPPAWPTSWCAGGR